ncbi:hypothetical protein BFN03_07050 [Rhodococcus sp. WMMA185]|uniref:DUF3320 domain-containing protein n=1 Tax=Rhodococcus sp. WMMA185 TaxID=679318 RepID=UPI000878A25C|nr:DUF3320 domain-containing protein [Rhodococcus sp. WMMA185]AOW92545.1 hypothetical protein BFN03_07050 [Rhodococcus sp. WMMA185]
MTFDPKLSVTEGLDHLAERLDPIITAKFEADVGSHPWTVILDQLDQIAGRPRKVYSTTDLQSQLKILTRRLGNLGFPFDDNRQTVGTLGRELTIVRNSRAHGDPFTCLDAWRAHDYAVRLLEHFGDATGLVKANELRQCALIAYVEEQGIAPVPVPVSSAPQKESEEEEPAPAAVKSDADDEPEVVTPDPEVYSREPSDQVSVVGDSRLEFEPWELVPIGDITVLDDLPKVAAKQKVRAVAVEIVEAEGPICMDRLAQLIAASFGLQKLHANRAAKIIRQVKAAGFVIDEAKFVWPADVDPEVWAEFRPNTSQVDRPFLHVSPVEIANAMRFLQRRTPGISEADLDSETLRTFGRKRRTKQCAAHLVKSKALL